MAEHKRHQGHRQRMRERVQNYGLDSLAEHEALEYVLYLTNAQKDTNGIAHDLIDRFGDFAAVLEASEEELCTVEGVGPATARMLHLLPEISRYYGRSRTSTTRCIRTTEQMGSYLMAKFAWSDYERAMLVSLDSRKRVRAAVWLPGRHHRPGKSGHQGCGVCGHQERHRHGGAQPQPPQRCGLALHGGSGGHWQYCPGIGPCEHPSAGSLHPDRYGVFLHEGRKPPADL